MPIFLIGATFSQPRVGLAPSGATFSRTRMELAPSEATLSRGPYLGQNQLKTVNGALAPYS